MTESETNFEVAGDTGAEALRDELESLRTLVSVTLILLIVSSLCLNAFLFKQCLLANEQKDLILQNEATSKNAAIAMWTKLNDFSKGHPDFAPLMDKYRIYFNTNSSAPAKK